MKPLAIFSLFFSLLLLATGCNLPADATQQNGGNEPKADVMMEKPIDETADGALILYWANGCSHCDSVKFKIENGKLDEKLDILYKESYNDEANYQEFFTRAKYCQIPIHQMGVPMMWDGYECYRGVEEIMSAIADKLKMYN